MKIGVMIKFYQGLAFIFLMNSVAIAQTKDGWLIPNGGQWPNQVLAHTDMPGLRIFVERDRLTWVHIDRNAMAEAHEHPGVYDSLPVHSWQSIFEGSGFSGQPTYQNKGAHAVSYFLGNDPNKWVGALVPARSMTLSDFYPGIDLNIQTTGGFKYEFRVRPGAHPNQIRCRIEGIEWVLKDRKTITYHSKIHPIMEEAPRAWSIAAEGGEQAVTMSLNRKGSCWGFEVGHWPVNSVLVLDPVLVGSTYSGSTADNWGFSATYASDGSIFLGGIVFDVGYPTSIGAYDISFNGGTDMVVSKYAPDATSLIFSTHLGGTSGDTLLSLVSDAQNRLYILGKSLSTNYPAFGFDPTHNGGMDYVVSRLNPTGTQLLSSTYLGGNGMDGENFGSAQMQNLNALWFNYGDNNRGEITLDPAGRVLIVGNTTSTNFPTSLSGHQQSMAGIQDGVLVKLSANLDSLIYASYLGGSQQDAIYGIRAMGVDTVYITGSTFSSNFPISSAMGGYIPQYQGGGDGFLLAIRTTGGPPVFGTFLGNASYQQAYLLDQDAEGRVYVTGISTSALAVTPNGIYNNTGGKHFIQVFSSDLDSLLRGTMIGANSVGPNFSPTAFMVDICGKVYLTGWGGSVNTARNIHVSSMVGLPVTTQRLQATTDHHDMYVMVFESNLDSLLYGSFFGGGLSREHVDGGTCRFSRDGVIYHAVCAGCGGGNDDFPTTPSAWSATNNSLNCNAAVFKIDLQYVQPVAGFATQYPDTFVCMGVPVQFFSTGTLSGTFLWDFGVPGAQSTLPNPAYSFPAPGTYRVTQRISSCVGTDTIGRNIIVKPIPALQLQTPPAICLGDSVTLTAAGARYYEWDSLYSGGGHQSAQIRVSPPSSRWYRVVASDSLGCPVTDSVWVRVNVPRRVFSGAIYRYCLGDTARISVPVSGYSSVLWSSDPEIISSTAFGQKFASMQARWVYLELTDTAGCRLRDSLRLIPFTALSVDAGPNRTICSPTQLTFTAQAPPQARFLWSTGDTSRQISFFAGQSQTLWVRAFDPPCSSLADTIQIVYEPLQAAFGFSPDTGYAPQTVAFTQLSSGASVSRYLWTFGDGGTSTLPAPVHTYMRPGRYTIVLRIDGDDPSCFDTAQSDIWIDSVGIRLPTAFTPDGDGVNDVFTGFTYGFETLSISIFDRWGRLVHHDVAPRVYWDGTQQGMPLPSGTYPYIIRAVQKNGVRRTLKGVVDLIR